LALIEVIEWREEMGDEMVARFPNDEIKVGAQLTVRENQDAVFYRDGKAYDVFGPGRHTLTTANFPLLKSVISTLLSGGESPFKAEVYFVNRKTFRNFKWGTAEPVPFRDAELGMVRLRAYGTYSMVVSDSRLFVNKIVGTQGLFTTNDITDYIRGVILSRFTDILGENMKSIFDLVSIYDELGVAMKGRVVDDLAKYGLEVRDFFVNAITPPPEVEKAIDERAGMGAVGDMNKYMQYKTAKAIEEAAGKEGTMGEGMGLGMGIGAGMTMAQQMQMMGSTQTMACPNCNTTIPANSRFCPSCGQELKPQVKQQTVTCPACGKTVPLAKFCGECGAALMATKKCPSCKKEIPAGAKFCPNCGKTTK